MMARTIQVKLKQTVFDDFDKLFQIQLDFEENDLNRLTPLTSKDRTAFKTKWTKLLIDPTVNIQTIIINRSEIVGSISKFEREGESEVTYILSRRHWGKGITTLALNQFLKLETYRPIYGRTAFDNYGSQKVLAKCGFKKIGRGKYFSNSRNSEIEEFIYRLDC